MRIQYFPDTDTLYVNLSDVKAANTDMVTENLLIDFDDDERVVGITIEQASQTINLSGVETIDLPGASIEAINLPETVVTTS